MSYVLSRSCRVRVRARVRVRVRARVSVRVRARVSVRVRVRAQPLLQAVQLRLEGGDALAALRLVRLRVTVRVRVSEVAARLGEASLRTLSAG